jgi:hypothetical protein
LAALESRVTHIAGFGRGQLLFLPEAVDDYIRVADERLNEYLERLDHGDVEDGATSGGARTKNLVEEIAELGQKRSRYQRCWPTSS